jgi:hypothetical protein
MQQPECVREGSQAAAGGGGAAECHCRRPAAPAKPKLRRRVIADVRLAPPSLLADSPHSLGTLYVVFPHALLRCC